MKGLMWILTIIACLGLLFAPGLAEEAPAEDKAAEAAAETEGIFAGAAFTDEDGRYGVLVGMPNGGAWSSVASHKAQLREIGETTFSDEKGHGGIYYSFYALGPKYGMMEDPDRAREFYRGELAEWIEQYPNGELKEFEIDGHPAMVFLLSDEATDAQKASGTGQKIDFARIMYARNTVLFLGRIQIFNHEDFSRLTMDDVGIFLKHIRYDASRAPITAEDAVITLTEKNGATTVSAGKKLTFAAAFANPERINKKSKNDGITWTVTNAAGEPAENVKIAKGVLTVDRKLTDLTELTVTARSDAYWNTSSVKVTAYPALQGVVAEPAELTFYLGATEPQTVKARMNPDVIPAAGFTWKSGKPAVAEVADNGDGTAVITAKGAGKTTVTVREPGGKSAKINVLVGEPVTAVELTCKDKAKAGGFVTVNAKLTPAKPLNKNVEWSVDVGKDVATINANGWLKIQKGVADGTVITVTCKAPGAPEPLTETIQITVGQ